MKRKANPEETGRRAVEARGGGDQGGEGREQSRSIARGPFMREPSLSAASFAANPFSFIRRFSEEMDRLFSDWFSEGSMVLGGERPRGSSFWPQMEVRQDGDQLLISADLPGLEKDDVTIEIENDTLIVRGERRQEREDKEGGLRRTERSYGSFYRALRLPEGADTERANAQFRNGVLEIRVPMPAGQRQSRRIPIQSEGRSGEARAAGSEVADDRQRHKAS